MSQHNVKSEDLALAKKKALWTNARGVIEAQNNIISECNFCLKHSHSHEFLDWNCFCVPPPAKWWTTKTLATVWVCPFKSVCAFNWQPAIHCVANTLFFTIPTVMSVTNWLLSHFTGMSKKHHVPCLSLKKQPVAAITHGPVCLKDGICNKQNN